MLVAGVCLDGADLRAVLAAEAAGHTGPGVSGLDRLERQDQALRDLWSAVGAHLALAGRQVRGAAAVRAGHSDFGFLWHNGRVPSAVRAEPELRYL